ncbi:MAG: M14 family zinc carboxypeptidase [Bacteroidota bacterium]
MNIPKYIFLISLFLINFISISAQPELKFEENQSLTWKETIEYYKFLDEKHSKALLMEAGLTDIGKPLHLFLISGDTIFTPELARKEGKSVLFINNGIHPGEPCGIDASILFAEEILSNPEKYEEVLNNLVIAIIPVLNVGGSLNRSEFHRANQNGPIKQGFRGNAKNMDLKRDLIKMDTENVRSLVRVLRIWNPDILIDTHTSNGADYPYVLTLITTQKDKLNLPLSDFLYEDMLPRIYNEMEAGPYKIVPYVQNRDYRNPESGIIAFMDHPRYTTGYASLFNTIGFTTEAHMFKNFEDRVLSTYHFIHTVSGYAAKNNEKIRIVRDLTQSQLMNKREFVLGWELDTSSYETLNFRGYKMKPGISQLTGQANYSFNRDSVWEKEIKNYTNYKPVKKVIAPDFYILPQAWKEVVERLKINKVEFFSLLKDTSLYVEYYQILDYETYSNPYNGHYKHFNTRVIPYKGKLDFHKGDLLIPLNQEAREYLVQVLEPEGEDSFFNWNFFDSILSRKEYFSPYVFEAKAMEILAMDSELQKEFNSKKEEDPDFASNHYDQLKFIYEHSSYAENVYKRYPVARLFIDK